MVTCSSSGASAVREARWRAGPCLSGAVVIPFALAALACTTTDRSLCGAGQTECAGTCAWLNRDPNNCGTCGAVCGQGHTCQAGTCVCPGDLVECDDQCIDVRTDAEHCGSCSTACSVGQSCKAGQCVCESGLIACGDRCVDTQSDPEHCGRCGSACAKDKFCSLGKCASGCAQGLVACGHACVDLDDSEDHCGQCGNACPPGRPCEQGVCACGTGRVACDTQCVDLSSNSSHCGACEQTCSADQVCVDGTCQCPSGQEPCEGLCVPQGTCAPECPTSSSMLSDFENGSLALSISTDDHWTGAWHTLGDATASNQTLRIEPIASEPCHKFALHTTGNGLTQPVGIALNFNGTPSAPEPYDAGRWAGIRFRARLGDQTTNTVRLNVVTPWTCDREQCRTTPDAVSDAGNHLGRFLRDENALTTEWKQLTFCFDRDLYPREVPSALTDEQRRQVASNVLEIQFQFNLDKPMPQASSAGTKYPQDTADAPFDFWVDDIELVEDSDACTAAQFQSTPGTFRPYPMNAKLGRCEPASDADKFNAAIARSYTRWRDRYVIVWADRSCSVDGVEPVLTNSQATGYAMLVAAAMGDKALFDCLWSYAQKQGAAEWLMPSEPDAAGSTTEADEDIAHALLVAEEQWHEGYQSRAVALIANMLASDVANDAILPGSEWDELDAFAPAAFTPSLYRVFRRLSGIETWARVLADGYQTLHANAQAFGVTQLVTDLCNSSGNPMQPSDYGLEVTGGFDEPLYGVDAARVPLRLSWDACLQDSSEPKELLSGILGFFVGRYDGGASIEHLVGGWCESGEAAPGALENQMAFIGPLGTGAMAFEAKRALRDRVFRVVLDLIESPQFNESYYQTTIGLITLLQMSGNLPHSS